jgi:hypothetical protein
MHREAQSNVVRVLFVLASGLGIVAQEPISDKLEVTLPNTTWVGSQSLSPGTYRIRQLPTASSPRLLEFSSGNGTKMEIAITTIAAIGNNTPHDTSVVLEQKDGEYHLTHVWIAGKTYGYQLPVRGRRQEASKSETVTLAANFVPNQVAPSTQESTRAQVPEQPKQEPQQVAQAKAPPAQTPVPTPTPEQPKQVAQAEIPQPTPAPQATAIQEPSAAPTTAGSDSPQTPPMPATATYWPEILLGGAVLMMLGLIVRPRASSAV